MKQSRQQQKEETRNLILETACRVYARQGFSATTAAIAEEAGLSHGGIFVHFPSRQALLTASVESFGCVLNAGLHRLSKAGGSVEALLLAHLQVLGEAEDFYIRLVTEQSLLPEEARNTFFYLQNTAAHHFGQVMERAMEAGRVKKLPIHLLFNTWMGLVHYYLQNKALFSPEGPLLSRYASELTETFSALIATEAK